MPEWVKFERSIPDLESAVNLNAKRAVGLKQAYGNKFTSHIKIELSNNKSLFRTRHTIAKENNYTKGKLK